MKVFFENPDMPKGMEFYVKDLGILKNGESTDVPDEQVAAFEEATGKKIKDIFPAKKGGDN